MQFCPLKRGGKKGEIEVGKNDVAAVTVMEDLDYKSRRGTSFGNYIPAFPSIRQTSMRKPLYRTNCAANVGGGEPSGMGCLFLKLFFEIRRLYLPSSPKRKIRFAHLGISIGESSSLRKCSMFHFIVWHCLKAIIWDE